jgi:GABA permease
MLDSGASMAGQRLDVELQRLHEAGAEADGEVGDPDPVKAIANTLARQPFDEIILSTLRQGRSRWLRQDLLSQVQKMFALPVTHIASA